MNAVGVVVLAVLACLGFGALVLRATGAAAALSTAERWCWSYALGLGVLGWFGFWLGLAGLFQPQWLAALLLTGAGAAPLLGRPQWPFARRPTAIGIALLAILAMVIGFDVAEALSPPTDADTLAYHFSIPRDWLAAGRLVFVPRAVDGAVPLLLQTTYVPALALGGERALNLWMMVSAWAGGALTYALARRWLPPAWSGAAALAYLTVPAILAGGGSGQVEPRLALFATVGLMAMADARRAGRHALGLAAVAGLAAGWYVGAKYLGLTFAAALGLAILFGRGGLGRATAFGGAALAAGGQWYWWNWHNAGDPLFPMLYRWLGSPYWHDAVNERFQGFFLAENFMPRGMSQFLLYPIQATIGGMEQMDATRTGLGPLLLLLLPFAIGGLWQARRRLTGHPLAPAAVAVLLFYAVWFFVGPSQRVRHLLPLLPVALVAGTVAARRFAAAAPSVVQPVAAAYAATLVLQLGIAGLFALPYLRHLASGESRSAFLGRVVSGNGLAVDWLNANLGPHERVLTYERQLVFLLNVPVHYGHALLDPLVPPPSMAIDPVAFLAAAHKLGITHILTPVVADALANPTERTLMAHGCAQELGRFAAPLIASKTVPTLAVIPARAAILRLTPCALDKGSTDARP